MRSENDAAGKPARRITRSRLAKPLLTSLGTVTMLAASSFVLLAVASTGSAKPWDWTRTDPAAALGRYQYCGHQGLGTIGCMLSSGFRPAAAAPATAAVQQPTQPLMSVATVQDQAPAQAPGSASGSAGRAAPAASRHGSAPPATTTRHLVQLQPGESTADILTACRTAMQAAQGTAATTEVTGECVAALQPRCPAARMPQAQGAAAIDELQAACQPAPSPSASPGHEGGDD
jgi:hypothetical protein